MPNEETLHKAPSAIPLTGSSGDPPELDRLVPVIYSELLQMAKRQLGREHRQMTMQTTELVHEAYLRLADDERVMLRGRAYFFAAAARAMRRVLVDAARRRDAGKRGGGVSAVTLNGDIGGVDVLASELLDLDLALQDLERLSPRQAKVVECRFFGGLTVDETAAALDVSSRTVKSDWSLARAWLYAELRGTQTETTASSPWPTPRSPT